MPRRSIPALMVLLAAAATTPGLVGPAAAGPVSSEIDLALWGRTVFNTHYDTALQAQEFISYLVDDTEEELNFNPREALLGLAASHADGDWTYRAVVELDFYGANASNNLLPRLRLGYAEARSADGWTIRGGQDWVPVAQRHPGTLDFGCLSWAGNLWHRTPQLTVRRRTGDWEALVGAMKHRISSAQEQQEIMPWVMGRVAGHDLLGAGSLVALGGGYRSVTVNDSDYSPYLVAGELVLPLGPVFTLTAEAYLGEGVGREFVHHGFDYNPEHPEGALAIASLGGFASLRARVSAPVELNAGLGMDDPDDDDLRTASRGEPSAPATFPAYLKNTVLFGNLKYHVNAFFGWGVEVAHLATDVGAEDDLSGQRYTTSVWFRF